MQDHTDLIDETNLREQHFSRYVAQDERFFQMVTQSCSSLKGGSWPVDRKCSSKVRCSALGALSSSAKEQSGLRKLYPEQLEWLGERDAFLLNLFHT